MSEKTERVKAAIDELLAALKDFFPEEVYKMMEQQFIPLKALMDSPQASSEVVKQGGEEE